MNLRQFFQVKVFLKCVYGGDGDDDGDGGDVGGGGGDDDSDGLSNIATNERMFVKETVEAQFCQIWESMR